MKLLFFSPDKSEVAEVTKELEIAGIACEVRRSSGKHHRDCDFGEAEIWVQRDRDCHRAQLLCVEHGIGFAKRPDKPSMIESWTDITSGTRFMDDEDSEERSPAPAHDIKSCTHRIRKLKVAA